MKKRYIALLLLLLVGGGTYLWATTPPPGPRSIKVFDPDRTADLELQMWRAYYTKNKKHLLKLLLTLLREQYHYPWSLATKAAIPLARAAATFGDTRENYQRVLPDLEYAYAINKGWLATTYDPRAVAKAELAWWVARRTPGKNSATQVGDLIAQMYSLFYEVPKERVAEAGHLRAEAAALRDRGRQNADWETIGALLRRSYRSLYAAVR